LESASATLDFGKWMKNSFQMYSWWRKLWTKLMSNTKPKKNSMLVMTVMLKILTTSTSQELISIGLLIQEVIKNLLMMRVNHL
jgi:hypothetical protein